MVRFRSVLRGGGAGSASSRAIDDKVSGISLLYIKSFDNLCGGAVGSKGGACICDIDKCGVSSHSKKVHWPTAAPALFLINKTRSNSVYLEPFLPLSLLADEDEVGALLQEHFTMDTWAERVSHYEFAARVGTSVANAGAQLQVAKQALKTPTMKGGKRQADFEESLAQLQLHSAKKPASKPTFLTTIEEKISDLSMTPDVQGQEILSALDLVPLLVDLAKELQGISEKEDVKVEHAAASSDFVKTEIADLNSQLGAVSADITGLKAVLGPRLNDIMFQGNIFEILFQLESILKQSGTVDAAKEGSPLVSQSLLSSVILPYKSAIENLNVEVNALRNGHRGGIVPGNFPAPANLHRAPVTTQIASNAPSGLDSWKNGIESQVAELRRIFSNFGKDGDTGVNFRGVSFTSRSEMNAWFELKEGTRALLISLFQCHVTLFHRMHTVLMGEHLDLKEAKVISDMKVKDYDVNAVQALVAAGLPRFFKGKKSGQIYTGANTGGPKHRLEGCSSLERFNLPSKSDGLHYRALESLDKVIRACQHEAESDAKSPEVKLLSSNTRSRGADFIRAVFMFMIDMYQEYLGSLGNANKTWDFVCECVEKILTTEFQEARSLATGMDFNDPEFASKMIWCSLKITCVQEKFLEVGLSNHPVISSTCSRYLIKNSNMGNVDTFRTTMEGHALSIATMETTIAELRNQVRNDGRKWKEEEEEDVDEESLRTGDEDIGWNGERQEFVGMVPSLESDDEQWILSEGWPSWHFILKSLGCKNIYTCTRGLKMKELEELKVAGVDEGLISWNILERCLLRKASKPRRMWIRGSREFVLKAIKLANLYNFTTHTSVIVEMSKGKGELPSDHGLVWRVLNHARLGGLTKGNYKVSSTANNDVGELYKVAEVRPRIGSILRGHLYGEPFDNSEVSNVKKNFGILDERGLAKMGQEEVRVIAPNFFTKTQCVRSLSDEELMDVYDVDVAVQKKLLKISKISREDLSKSFIKQVPGKVLYRLGLTILKSLEEKKEPMDEMEEEKDAILGKRDRIAEEERESSVMIEEIKEVQEQDRGPAKDPNLKAAKNDDAKANVEEWNERAARSVGEKYEPNKHDKAFEVLRRGCLRWYQGRVRKSFRNYLKITYGDDWEELAYGRRRNLAGEKRKRGEEQEDVQDPWEIEEARRKRGGKSTEDDKLRRELLKDLKVGRDAIRRARGASWWEWDAGSTLYFWRWPEEYKKDVRDGLEVCVEGQLPEYWARQRWPEDPVEREQLKAKLHKPVIKRYIARGFVKSLTSFFSVPKGEGDIRIVYDATKSLLNEALWAPNFFLPSVDTVLRNASFDTYYGDIDLGEMFLNYFLDERLRPYAGVDITGIKERLKDELGRCISYEEKKRVLYRWERNLMGLKSSPYNSIRTFSWSEDFIRGDRCDLDNPLRWDWVDLNLPGSDDYNPSKAWVSRYDAFNQKLAVFFETFVDDIRTEDSGGEEACQQTTHVIASRINYLVGQQDSLRKRRKVSMKPGAWSGAMIWSDKEKGLFVTCVKEKWDKAKNIISALLKTVEESKKDASFDRKQLERDRGFLIHIARTFTQMVPYLKGIHHTLESWRYGQDEDGWKRRGAEIIEWLNGDVDFEYEEGNGRVTKKNWREAFKSYKEQFEGDAPERVKGVGRLKRDLVALSKILESEEPKRERNKEDKDNVW